MRKLYNFLRRHGPLGTVRRANDVFRSYSEKVPGCARLSIVLDQLICRAQLYFDRSFDRTHGVDTSGVIPLKNLTIIGDNAAQGVWYEPMSVKVFRQIMNHLNINYADFEFIDLGSGKGRVLLLAAEYEFKKVIGVEFAEELHRIASDNVAAWERQRGRRGNIHTVCMDAAEFPIPATPVVVFFYSPFRGSVMDSVLDNLRTSLAINPRRIVMIYYGHNRATIERLKSTEFRCTELVLRADWSRFTQYQAFLFTA